MLRTRRQPHPRARPQPDHRHPSPEQNPAGKPFLQIVILTIHLSLY